MENPSANKENFKYDLFVSYSTDPDYKLVHKLESFLESFHQLKTPKELSLRTLNVCVDGSDFTIPRKEKNNAETGNIPDVIKEHLSKSAELLVLCSAKACQSIWVNDEIKWFLENRGPHAIRLAVTEGIDPKKQPDEVFPQAIIDTGLHTKIWYDFRAFRGKITDSWITVKNYDNERTRLASDLQGKPAGTIQPIWFREQERAARHTRNISIGISVVMILLTIAAVFFAIQSNKNEKVANLERNNAERQARISNARRLAVEAESVMNEYPQRGLLLAIEAVNTTSKDNLHVPNAQSVLRKTLAATSGFGLSGHEDDINIVKISPDNHWLVTGSNDKTARLWNLNEKYPLDSSRILSGHTGNVTIASFSSNGTFLVTGTKNDSLNHVKGSAFLWNLKTANIEATKKILPLQDKEIWAANFSNDNHCRVTTIEADEENKIYKITVWDVSFESSEPELVKVFSVPFRNDTTIQQAILSQDNNKLAVVVSDFPGNSYDGVRYQTFVWDLSTETILSEPKILKGGARVVEISSNNRWILTDDGATAYLWDIDKNESIIDPFEVEHGDFVSTAGFSPNNRWLVTGSWDYSARLWDLEKESPSENVIILEGHKDMIQGLAISNKYVVTGSTDNILHFWNLVNEDPSKDPIVLKGHEGNIRAITISGDNHWLATGSWDNTARIWDLNMMKDNTYPTVLRGHETFIQSIATDPGCKGLFSGDSEDIALFWDINLSNSPEPIHPIRLPGSENYDLSNLFVSPDGQWVVGIHLPDFDGFGGRSIYVLKMNADNWISSEPFILDNDEEVTALAIRDNWLVAGGNAGNIRLWDLASLSSKGQEIKPLSVLEGHHTTITDIAISHNNDYIITSSMDGTVIVWMWDHQVPNQSYPLTEHNESVNSIAISTDDHWLVTGSDDKTVFVWDLTTISPESVPTARLKHENGVNIVKFSTNNRWLVTAGIAENINIWDFSKTNIGDISPIELREAQGIMELDISPDSKWLATVAQQKLFLWNLEADNPSTEPILFLSNPNTMMDQYDGITTIGFSPNSKWLISGGGDPGDPNIRLWNLRINELLNLASRIAGRDLTVDERDQYLR